MTIVFCMAAAPTPNSWPMAGILGAYRSITMPAMLLSKGQKMVTKSWKDGEKREGGRVGASVGILCQHTGAGGLGVAPTALAAFVNPGLRPGLFSDVPGGTLSLTQNRKGR